MCCCFFLVTREERSDTGRGFHGAFDLFGPQRLFPKIASRRESVDSSEENDDSKDGSQSPVGVYISSH